MMVGAVMVLGAGEHVRSEFESRSADNAAPRRPGCALSCSADPSRSRAGLRDHRGDALSRCGVCGRCDPADAGDGGVAGCCGDRVVAASRCAHRWCRRHVGRRCWLDRACLRDAGGARYGSWTRRLLGAAQHRAPAHTRALREQCEQLRPRLRPCKRRIGRPRGQRPGCGCSRPWVARVIEQRAGVRGACRLARRTGRARSSASSTDAHGPRTDRLRSGRRGRGAVGAARPDRASRRCAEHVHRSGAHEDTA